MRSSKFKHLEEASSLLPPGSVPQWKWIKSDDSLTSETLFAHSHILRSALRNEANGDVLMSGKSLSILGIKNLDDLLKACDRVFKQPELEEVMLQEERDWIEHVTLLVENNFYFAEIRKRDGSIRTAHQSRLTYSHTEPIHAQLVDLIDRLKPITRSDPVWLMELGSIGNDHMVQLHLFQIQPAPKSILSQLFQSETAKLQIQSKIRFRERPSLFQLLRLEWNAYQFRTRIRQHHPLPMGAHFENWEYLFHYFRLFCMIKNLMPDGKTFSEFLSLSLSNRGLGSMVRTHLEFANRHRQSDPSALQPTGFTDTGIYFIGQGRYTGSWGKEIVFQNTLEQPSPDSNASIRVILSRDVSLLSHPVLASIENGVSLVLGVSSEFETRFKSGDRVTIDFQNQSITLE